MNNYAFEIAIRKAVDALHEATAATKMLRLEAAERAGIRAGLQSVRERLLSLDAAVASCERLEAWLQANKLSA